jgi:hypothetical protein
MERLLSSGGSGMEEGANLGAEPLRGSAKDRSGEALVGLGPGPRVLLRGVVGPTGTGAADVDGRQSPNKQAGRRLGEATSDSGDWAEGRTGDRDEGRIEARERPVKRDWSRRKAGANGGDCSTNDGGSGGLVRRCFLCPVSTAAISKPCLDVLGGDWLRGALPRLSQERRTRICFGMPSVEVGMSIERERGNGVLKRHGWAGGGFDQPRQNCIAS